MVEPSSNPCGTRTTAAVGGMTTGGLNGVFWIGFRRRLAQAAGALPSVPGLLPAFSEVDPLGQVGGGAEAAGPALASAGTVEPKRGVLDATFTSGEKGARGWAYPPGQRYRNSHYRLWR